MHDCLRVLISRLQLFLVMWEAGIKSLHVYKTADWVSPREEIFHWHFSAETGKGR